MADPFVAEIRVFAFNFAPRGWAFCNGQIMPLSQNTALFSLLGTMYGGDGKSTFALPDLQGSAPLGFGQGAGLSYYNLGEMGGSETVTLIESEMPFHTHNVNASGRDAFDDDPGGKLLGRAVGAQVYNSSAPNTALDMNAIAPSGGSMPHNNMQPYLTLNFCIALQGIFPPRT